jgi:hypothetical protein
LRRHRHTIDDTLRLNLSVQRYAIDQICGRIDQVQDQADRQDGAQTDLEARIADLEAMNSALLWFVAEVAARGRPVMCPRCKTAYATTGLRWNGRNLELLCPVCGAMPWRRP